MTSNDRRLDLSTLASWLWEGGPCHPVPLVFLKRLSDVFEGEVQRLGQGVGGEDLLRLAHHVLSLHGPAPIFAGSSRASHAVRRGRSRS